MKDKKPFLEHLEEARKRIFFSAIIALALSIAAYPFAGKILVLLIEPLGRELVFLSPADAFIAYMKIAFFAGLAASLPFIVYQLMAFSKPAFTSRGMRAAYIIIPAALLLFIAGAALAYFIALPAALKFLLGFSNDYLKPMIALDSYISFSLGLIFAFGLLFELPLAIAVLARIGIVSAAFLREKRKYAIVLIFILAAVLTPSVDAFTQLILALPMVLLYELGIIAAVIFGK